MKKIYHDRNLRQKLGGHLRNWIQTPTRVSPKGQNTKIWSDRLQALTPKLKPKMKKKFS